MTRTIRVKTTFLGPTETLGARIRVTNTVAGERFEFPYPFYALDPHMACVMRAYPGHSIVYRGSHARGDWFCVTLN